MFLLLVNIARSQQYTEYEVKAGYIYNFAKFVDWPEQVFQSENSPFIIGIYGEDPFEDALDQVLKGRKILKRNWIIKYYNSPEEVDKCHILIVSNITKYDMVTLFEKIGKEPILTIGDNVEEFCENGGIINFTGRYSRHRFQINNISAARAGIMVSSKLLALAKIITEDEIKF
jgi:hypothetical protein